MPTFLYFAYGSNMLTERLNARCVSARFVGVAEVYGYGLVFNKTSVDGSGKATLVERDGVSEAGVYGCLYDLDVQDRGALDACEGVGYERLDLFPVRCGARDVSAVTYIAKPDAIDPTLKPYDWYLALVVAGAKQNGLPPDYVTRLEAVAGDADPIADRQRRQEALQVLAAAGYPFAA